MKYHSNPSITLRGLRDKPVTILIALGWAPEPVTQAWLCEELMYDRRTTYKYMRYLERLGYVERLGTRSWRPQREKLIWLWRQLGLASDSPPDDHEQSPAAVVRDREAQDRPQAGDSPPFSIRTRTCIGNHEEIKHGKGSTERDQDDERLPLAPELKVALQAAGIKRHRWPKLASLPHITPDYVRAHHAHVMQHPDPRKRNTGFLIHVLESGDPAPEFCQACGGLNGEHALDCAAQRRRYTSGKYGDLFEH